MAHLENLVDAIGEALDEHKAIDVLAVISGALIALVEDSAKRAGHDPSKQIALNVGESSRKIVIHALDDK